MKIFKFCDFLLEDFNGKFEMLGIGSIEIHTSAIDYRSGQHYMTTFATLNNETIGWVDWSEYNKEIYIDYVEVKEPYRMKGLAKKLFNIIKESEPGKKIHYGYTSELGSKFLKAHLKETFVPKNIENREKEAKEKYVLVYPKEPTHVYLKTDRPIIRPYELTVSFSYDDDHKIFGFCQFKIKTSKNVVVDLENANIEIFDNYAEIDFHIHPRYKEDLKFKDKKDLEIFADYVAKRAAYEEYEYDSQEGLIIASMKERKRAIEKAEHIKEMLIRDNSHLVYTK